uniref:Uncharacterized protein n=1 Tax=Anopheles atroparvus TaxID=41427 RepID=A0AAG5D3X5_ANOAO
MERNKCAQKKLSFLVRILKILHKCDESEKNNLE